MRTLVIGGAASGKSALAENLAVHCPEPRFYIATLMPFDDESRRRIQKHQAMRAQKHFATLECYTGLAGLLLPARGSVLLECIGNLAANEMFAPDGVGTGEQACQVILSGLAQIENQCSDLVVVTNDVFADGGDYPEETRRYMANLGAINAALAKRYERVVEVVCGIPICRKGEIG